MGGMTVGGAAVAAPVLKAFFALPSAIQTSSSPGVPRPSIVWLETLGMDCVDAPRNDD